MMAMETTQTILLERVAGLDSKLGHLTMRVHHEVFQVVTVAARVQEVFSVERRRYTTARRVEVMSEVKEGPTNRVLILEAATLVASHVQIRSKIWVMAEVLNLHLTQRSQVLLAMEMAALKTCVVPTEMAIALAVLLNMTG